MLYALRCLLLSSYLLGDSVGTDSQQLISGSIGAPETQEIQSDELYGINTVGDLDEVE